MRTAPKIAAVAAIAAIPLGALSPSAQASSGSYHGCVTWHDKYSAGGYCKGTGPAWEYQAWGDCYGGSMLFGPLRWDGDRRGSYIYCKQVHSSLRRAWFKVFHNGDEVKSVWIKK